MKKLFVLIILNFFCFSLLSYIQNSKTSGINGIIKTTDGVEMPGVKVIAKNLSMNKKVVGVAISNENGVYHLLNLEFGIYKIS